MEWKLDTRVFRDIDEIYGPLDIDLFASRINAQLKTYVSFLPDPTAIAVDAFSLTWTVNKLYFGFPPFSLLGRVLQKLEEDRARMVLVAPLWTTQHWFPKMLRLLTSTPRILPNLQQLLYLPNRPQKEHPIGKMRLIVCKLSGIISESRDYHQTLPTSYYLHGENQHNSNIGCISEDGCFFHSDGRVIQFLHL